MEKWNGGGCLSRRTRVRLRELYSAGRAIAAPVGPRGARILVQEVPCSGKMDGRYLFHAFEGGARGVCVVACPKGECRLAQGNYRAEVRVRMVRKLLGEIGLEPERSELLHCSPEDSFDSLEESVHQAVNRLCALGPTLIQATPMKASPEVAAHGL